MITNTYCGVRLPRTIAFLDLRDGIDPRKGNKSAGDIVGELLGIKDCARPISLQWYWDAREATDNDLGKEIKHLRRIACEYIKDWRKALRNPAKPGQGGGAFYKPKAIYITNFGGSLVCDRSIQAIRCFNE